MASYWSRIVGVELEVSLDKIFSRQAENGFGLVLATGPNQFVGPVPSPLEDEERREMPMAVAMPTCGTKIFPKSQPIQQRQTRACPQLSQMVAAAKWIAARKFRAVLS